MDYEKEAARELVSDEDRVEIIMLVVENDRDVAMECINAILTHVKYPFKLSIYENSLNSSNTAKIWNKLVRESGCGYICLIDSDAIPKNDFISEMMIVLKRHPEAAAVGPAGDASSFVNVWQKAYNPNSNEFPMADDLSGFCFLFRKAILEEYGYFDERFVFYGQDSEWTYRMSLLSKVFYVVPKAYVNHKNSVSSFRKEVTDSVFSRNADSLYGQALMRKIKAGTVTSVAQTFLQIIKERDYKEFNPWKYRQPVTCRNLV